MSSAATVAIAEWGHRAAEILQELERRQDLDTLGNQIVRARAAVAARKSELARREVFREGRSIELTATEFALLAALARQPGRVYTRAQLLDAIHGDAFEAYERAIDAHVKNIRRKLEPDPRTPRYVETVIGVGYRLNDDPVRG